MLTLGCERGAKDCPVMAWDGWDRLKQAKALSDYCEQHRQEGASEIRRLLVLAGLQQLTLWPLQRKNEVDLEVKLLPGDFCRDHVREEASWRGRIKNF